MKIIHPARTISPIKRDSLMAEAKLFASSTTDRIARRRGITRARARSVLASEGGVLPGTLETLERDRLKTISAADYLALKSIYVREIRREIADLETEVARARALGDDADRLDLCKIEAAIKAARSLIGAV